MAARPIAFSSMIVSALFMIELTWGSVDRYHQHLVSGKRASTNHEDYRYWDRVGRADILKSLEANEKLNKNLAKNVIIFVGDGMSLPTLTASRIYQAQYSAKMQKKKVNGEESLLFFETFPHLGLSKTYSVDAQTPDSSSTATAIFTGVKTDINTLGFDNSVVNGSVASESTAHKVESIMAWAQEAGKDTGFVTNARVSHATPAALYAHSAFRDWECNKIGMDGSLDSSDITWQLIHNNPGRNAKVILGGGRSSFLPFIQTEETARWNYSTVDWKCLRKDNLNLLQEFLKKPNSKYVENRGELFDVKLNETDFLLGLFSWDHMKYEFQREKRANQKSEEPSLVEMTKAAINVLQRNDEKGFFLMVEGGKIDMAHHDAMANAALHETMAFDLAVKTAFEMTDREDTLIIVTADHGHTMTMAGYQTRGSDIRGIVNNSKGSDGKDLSILSYANGPRFYDFLKSENNNVSRVDVNMTSFTDFNQTKPVGAPTKAETHSGSDVGIFASGPFAHLFHSVHEQNFIAYVMAYSACVGPYKYECHSAISAAPSTTSATTTTTLTAQMAMLLLLNVFARCNL